MGNETLEQQATGQHKGFERFFESASQNQFIKNNIGDKIKRAVDNAVSAVENLMQFLTVTIKMVIPRVDRAGRSITGSSGHGPDSEFRNPDRKDFSGNYDNTLLMLVSS